MLIIGSTELTFTKEKGSFHCPTCNELTPYRHRRRRSFVTLYFVPLIPLKLVAEFIECATCRQTFELNVLDLTPAEIEAAKRHAVLEMIRRVLVVIVAADDEVTDDELGAVCAFARQCDMPEVSRQQVMSEASAVRQSGLDPLAYIRQTARQLSEEDKNLLIYHAFLAATAGGDLSDTRQNLLRDLPDAIGVSEDRFREIISRAVEES